MELSSWSVTDWGLGVLTALIGLYVLGTWNYDHFKKRGLHYIKPTLPFLGNFSKAFLGFKSFAVHTEDMYNAVKGHKYVGVFEFTKPFVMVTDPEVLKVVGVKQFDHFMNHRQTFSERSDPIFGKNLFTLRDQRWRDMRATLSPAFTTSKIKNMFLLVSECGKQLTDHLDSKSRDGKMLTLEMKDLFTKFTNDVIATVAFGLSCDSLNKPDNDFYTMGKEVTNFGGKNAMKFIGFILFPKLMEMLRITLLSEKAKEFFRTLVHGTIATRKRESIYRPDMLQLLMQSKTELEDDEVTAQAVIFFFAGFETVSTLLCFTSYVLATHEDVQERLRAEIDSVLAEHGELNYEALNGMKYLDMVVSETLRLYPPVPAMDRQCSATCTLPATDTDPAITFKEGDILFLPVQGFHHDPDYFPEPLKFDPERFNDENKNNIKPFTYLPFGVGPRLCIAQRFALMEAKVALVNLLSRFSLHVVDKTPIPMKLKKGGFNIMAEGGFWTGIKPRAT